MARYLEIDGDQIDQVASNSGWGDFCRWADGLDEEQHGAVKELCDRGECEPVAALADQLGGALSDNPPTDETILKTARGLHERLASYYSAGHVGITHGLTG